MFGDSHALKGARAVLQPCVSLRSTRPAVRRGATLVELMVVMAVMLAAAGIFSQMMIATAQLREVQRENAIAAEAARVLIEEMRNEEFRHLFFLYNQDPLDDPAGAGTAPGHRFLVRGLNALPGSPDGLQMEVIFPAYQKEVESTLTGTKWETRIVELEGEEQIGMIGGGGGMFGGGGMGGGFAPPEPSWQLREDYVSADWGMPRDLSGDSVIDDLDHSLDVILLPVTVRLEWRGSFGPRTYQIQTMLADFIK